MKNEKRPAYVWVLVLVLLGLAFWMVFHLVAPVVAKTEQKHHEEAETPITMLMPPVKVNKPQPVEIPLVSDEEREDILRAAGLGGGFATFSPSLREEKKNN